MRQAGAVSVGGIGQFNTIADWDFLVQSKVGAQELIASNAFPIAVAAPRLMRRDIDVPANGLELEPIDVDADGVAMERRMIEVDNTDPRETYEATVSLRTARGGTLIYESRELAIHVAPASFLLPSDSQGIELDASIQLDDKRRLVRGGTHSVAADAPRFSLLPTLEAFDYGIGDHGFEVDVVETSVVPQFSEIILTSGDMEGIQESIVSSAWLAQNPEVQLLKLDAAIPGYQTQWIVAEPQFVSFGVGTSTDFSGYVEIFGAAAQLVPSFRRSARVVETAESIAP